MPSTVAASFDAFRSEIVDLDPDDVKRARISRNYLQEQIQTLESNDPTFPRLYNREYHSFGSFARRTQVRPLNDVDILILLNGHWGYEIDCGNCTYKAQITNTDVPISIFSDVNGYVNSTRVLNKFKSSLANISTYRSSEIKRNGVAVVLNLISYNWSFDIVPGFPVVDNLGNIIHYIIPNGNGDWTRTNPRRDQTIVTVENQYHNSHLLPLIRLIKYWNAYSFAAPRMTSYHLETMLINGFKNSNPMSSIRRNIRYAFGTLSKQIGVSCPDPKGLGPNLDNGINSETREKIRMAALEMGVISHYAIEMEDAGKHKEAIKLWQRVFPRYPDYG